MTPTEEEVDYWIWTQTSRSLSTCPAASGGVTHLPRRTAHDEQIDRHHTSLLGTFSAHSLLLGFIEALESISTHLDPICTEPRTKRSLTRQIAHVRMAAASLTYEIFNKIKLRLGRYTGESEGFVWDASKFEGTVIRGVLRGGNFNRKIVHWVGDCARR